MTVYVLMMGCSTNYDLYGVYSTLEKAQAAGGGEWRMFVEPDEMWVNDKEWDAAASIRKCTIDEVML